jgi:hypothetical protein
MYPNLKPDIQFNRLSALQLTVQPFYVVDVGTLHQCLQQEYAGVLSSRPEVDKDQAQAVERVVEDLVFLSFFVRPSMNSRGNNSCTMHVALMDVCVSVHVCVCVFLRGKRDEGETESVHHFCPCT